MTLQHTAVVILLSLMFPALGTAAPFDNAAAAHSEGERAMALQVVRPLAEQGDAIAQYHLGKMYAQGRVVSRNDGEAVKWLRLAAERGIADAQYDLGLLYDQDQNASKDLLRKHPATLEPGYSRAFRQDKNRDLTQIFLNKPKSSAVRQSYDEALKWYRLAADQGHAAAQVKIGNMYEYGRGVAQDHDQALRWYRLAADQGHAPAQFNVGNMHDNGRGVLQDYAQALRWYRLAAEQGYAVSQYVVGVMYAVGQGVRQDYVEAAVWVKKAADQGMAIAQANIGVMHLNGQGVPKDYVRAYMWLTLAAMQNEHDAITLKDKLDRQMSATQIKEAKTLVGEWKPNQSAR